MAYGNTSVSALLNQARAALKKQQGLEEQIAAYEYDLSPKDQAAWQKYNDFLGNRVKQVQATDPSKALSLQRLQTGANRTFTSSEIQRQSINILEGGGSKQQKLNTMINLYRKAIENGDENLAQRLQLQADTLQQTIMNEAAAGAGRGGGGGGGSAGADPQVKGFKKTVSDLEKHKQLLDEELRSGRITTKQYMDGYKDKETGQQILGVRGSLQNIADIQKSSYDYAQRTGSEDAINYYGELSNKIKNDGYQDFINKAGDRIAAGQAPGAREYNYNTGRWEFKSPSNIGIDGYKTGDFGAMFALKDKSDKNIIGTDVEGTQVYLPKEQMNQLTEQKDGNKIKMQQYSGFLPGMENSPADSYFGRKINPFEMNFTQNDKGETTGVAPLITMYNPITGELNRDPITGEVRQLRPEDMGATGTVSQNPVIGTLQTGANAVLNPLVEDIKNSGATDPLDYGKKKVGEVINKAGIGKTVDTLKKQLGSFGITNPFASLAANGPGFNSFGVIQGLQAKAKDLQKQADARAAAEAQQRAAEFAASQARLNQANQAAITRQAQQAGINPLAAKSVLVQSSPQLTSQMGKTAFNNKYLGQIGKLYNGAL